MWIWRYKDKSADSAKARTTLGPAGLAFAWRGGAPKKEKRIMLPATSIRAIWYDGQSAVPRSALLFCRALPREMRICAPEAGNDLRPLSVWRLDDVRIISGKLSKSGREPVVLAQTDNPDQRLTLQEPDSIAALSQWPHFSQKGGKRRVWRRWLLGTAAVWAICLGLYAASDPLFTFLARLIPQSWEQALGRSSRDSLLQTFGWLGISRGICAQGEADADLRLLMRRLEQATPVHGYAFTLTVLDADFVNAFALPGGYVVVSTGLIKACASPDELAAVLAHEMTHVTERHGTAGLLRQYAWAGFARMWGGEDSLAGGLALTLITSSFSRDAERGADMLGIARLESARINPLAMADFFGRLRPSVSQDSSAAYSYFASHPDLAEREANIRRAVGQTPRSAYTPCMDARAWEKMRGLCGVSAPPAPQKSPPGENTPKTPPGTGPKPRNAAHAPSPFHAAA